MSFIVLLHEFYNKNRIPAVILAVVSCVSLTLANFFVSQYRYLTYTQNMFLNSGLNHAVYYMPEGFGADEAVVIADVQHKHQQTVRDKIQKFSAVDSILTSPINADGCYLANDAYLQHFPLKITEGKSLEKSSSSDPTKTIDVVACGYAYKSIPVNSEITVTLFEGWKQQQDIKARIIGKAKEPSYTADFGIGGTNVAAANLFTPVDGYLVCRETPKLLSFFQKESPPELTANTQRNFFVTFKPNADEKEKQDCLNYMSAHGSYLNYNQITQYTQETVVEQMKRILPMPLFFLFVSTIAFISISVLFVCKKLPENSIYFLCGCSRHRGFATMAVGIGLLSLPAAIVNILLIENIDYLDFNRHYIPIDFPQLVMDEKTYLLILGYLLIVILLSIVIPYRIYRKNSPLEIIRRTQE